ncbi:MAG: rhombosortase [Gammaproteobacteria bacterium]|nr:rhombosortase [Gammaproteobacteria bacterium]
MVSILLRAYGVPLIVAIIVLALALGGDEAREALRYQADALSSHQWWRWESGHWVHLGWSHTVLNLAGLALVWALVGAHFSNGNWALIIIGSALGISFGLWTFNPELTWYVGFSGVLHTMLVAGALAGIRSSGRTGDRSDMLLLAVVLAKLVWEQVMGPLPGSEASAGGNVVVDAHWYGGLLGLFFGALLKPRAVRA